MSTSMTGATRPAIVAGRSNPEPIERALSTLRGQVRTLGESRTQLAAAAFNRQVQRLSLDSALAMGQACEGEVVLARLHDRLVREVDADLSRGQPDDDSSVLALASQVVLSRLRAQLGHRGKPGGRLESTSAQADLTPGGAEAMQIFEQYRGTVRHRLLELKTRLRRTLAEVSFRLASATAARLCLQYGSQRTEWLWWRLTRSGNPRNRLAKLAPSNLAGRQRMGNVAAS